MIKEIWGCLHQWFSLAQGSSFIACVVGSPNHTLVPITELPWQQPRHLVQRHLGQRHLVQRTHPGVEIPPPGVGSGDSHSAHPLLLCCCTCWCYQLLFGGKLSPKPTWTQTVPFQLCSEGLYWGTKGRKGQNQREVQVFHGLQVLEWVCNTQPGPLL